MSLKKNSLNLNNKSLKIPPCGVDITLRAHQENIITSILHKRRCAIFVAGTGSGKTISAIVAGVCLLTNRQIKGVVIVTPVGVHQQFVAEVNRLVPPKHRSVFLLYTHHKFFHEKTDFSLLSDKLLVIDEVHILTTTITINKKKDDIGSGKLAFQAIEASRHAANVLLMTATPIKNSPIEMFNLICMVKQQPYRLVYKEFSTYRKKLEKLTREYLRTGNSYLLRNQPIINSYINEISPYFEFAKCSREGYPKCNEKIVRLTMGSKYLVLYNKVENDEIKSEFDKVLHRDNITNSGVPLQLLFDPAKATCFYSKLRIAVNGMTEFVVSKKVKEALHLIYNCYKYHRKVLLYSAFLNGGLSLIARILDEKNIPYLQITGSVSAVDRKKIVDIFNNDIITILLISAAGSEGLDLKCVRDVILLEPHFHDVRIEQVIGRAVRYRSHETLPPEERNVTIHRMLLCKPSNESETWEEIDKHNIHQVTTILKKYQYEYLYNNNTVLLDMNIIYKPLVQNTINSMDISQKQKKNIILRTHNTNSNMLKVFIPSKYMIIRMFQSYVDSYIMKTPPTDVSVDDILHRLAQNKKKFIKWHLNKIRGRHSSSRQSSHHKFNNHSNRQFIDPTRYTYASKSRRKQTNHLTRNSSKKQFWK